MSKSILFLTVTFPPRLSVASLRLYHFTKLFQSNGWKVTVLTASQAGEKKSIEFDLENMEVIYVPWRDPFDPIVKIKNVWIRKFCFKAMSFFIPYLATWYPDLRFKTWRKNALKLAAEIHEKEQFSHIFSTYSPPSPHMVASTLKRKYPNLTWVAEFRDLMSFSHSIQRWEYPFALLHNEYEKKLFKNCNEILCVSKGHAAQLSVSLKKNINVLYNGCDFDTYNTVDKVDLPSFTIVYTGNLYRKRNDVEIFFKGMKMALETSQSSIELIFLGTPQSNFLKRIISKYQLEKSVSFKQKQDHSVVKTFQKSADILLHFCWNKTNQNGNLTGKIFEYISARKPVLSVGNQEEVVEILSKTASGKTMNTPKEIADFIINEINHPKPLIQLSNDESDYSKLNQFKRLEKRILSA